MSKDDDDLGVEGRLADGWEYAVHLMGGKTLKLRDHDKKSSVIARWLTALAASGKVGSGPEAGFTPLAFASTMLSFSGCKDWTDEDQKETGKLDGTMDVPAGQVVGIGYWGFCAQEPQSAAAEAARAYMEAQASARDMLIEDMRRAQEQAQGEGEGGGEGAEEGKGLGILSGGG